MYAHCAVLVTQNRKALFDYNIELSERQKSKNDKGANRSIVQRYYFLLLNSIAEN